MKDRQKVALVTGATGALGSAMASKIADKGYLVVLVARSAVKAEKVASRIEREGGQVQISIGDLSSVEAAKRLGIRLRETYPAVDLLVNNAAIFSGKRKVTGEGFELMFATNHLGPFLLTNQLIESLRAAAPARIISISAPTTTRLDFDDLQSEKNFSAFRAFGASKMCNLLTTFKLARTLDPKQVTANVVHPGLIRSNLMDDTPALIADLFKMVSRRPEMAAADPVWIATDPLFDGITGKFFKRSKGAKPAAYSLDESVQDRLWKATQDLIAQTRT